MSSAPKGTPIISKLVEERIRLLEADLEFVDLCDLVPRSLEGKESGKDFHVVTTDQEYAQRRGSKEVVVLSKHDWERYERFGCLCDKLAQRYGLHWATVEDLAMGVKQPIVTPRLARTITAGLDPIVFLPKEFDPSKRYIAHRRVAPPLAAIEIMKRVQQLDDKTKDEIRAYLWSLFKDQRGSQVVELVEQRGVPEQRQDGVELDVHMRVPTGYTGNEVAEVYRKVDRKRRSILAGLGKPVRRRRRQSQTLMEAGSLELLLPENDVGILGIVDERYPDTRDEERRRKSVINKRYRGRRLLRDHLDG